MSGTCGTSQKWTIFLVGFAFNTFYDSMQWAGSVVFKVGVNGDRLVRNQVLQARNYKKVINGQC